MTAVRGAKDMVFAADVEKFLLEGIVFVPSLIVCAALTKPRFSWKISLSVLFGLAAAVVGIQAMLLAAGQDTTRVLTLLPLTAYLPAILCLHILSGTGFYRTMAVWTVGITVYFILDLLRKILVSEVGAGSAFKGWRLETMLLFAMSAAAALIVFLVFRFLRKPFRTYVSENQTNWQLLCFPVLMIFLLFSYFSNSATYTVNLAPLLLSAFSMFLALIRVLAVSSDIAELKAAEKEVAGQMELQRQEYEDMCKKVESGREYRHDMRHHLLAMEEMAKAGDNGELLAYIGDLSGRLAETAGRTYCKDPAVNAVLSASLQKAERAGCKVTENICLPDELPFERTDLCILLANTIENAVNACAEFLEKDRYIRLSAEFQEDKKLAIAVDNPCAGEVHFDREDFPDVPQREGHGIGLKSVRRIADKYRGFFQCECENGEFRFRAVLFGVAEAPQESTEAAQGNTTIQGENAKENAVLPLPKRFAVERGITCGILSLLTLFFLINCAPSIAEAMEQIPGLGDVARFADVRGESYQWGDTSFNAEYPVVEVSEVETVPDEETEAKTGEASPLTEDDKKLLDMLKSGKISLETGTPEEEEEEAETAAVPETEQAETEEQEEKKEQEELDLSEGVEDLNDRMEAYVAQMKEKFQWYANRKYNGYVGMDVTYDVMRDDEKLMAIRFVGTINVGGSGEYCRWFVLDKQSGEVVELRDLFAEGSDYMGVISAEGLRQMQAQVDAGTGDYYIPGGIWSDDECFKSIAWDQNFYINDSNELVIVFDEYEVASGNMGMPKFVIPTGVLAGILNQPSLIG